MAKFKIAKCYAKILPNENANREEYLMESLKTYVWVRNFIIEQQKLSGTMMN